MKFLINTTLLATGIMNANAFVVPSRAAPRFAVSSLNLERGDSTDAVDAALEASRSFGATSEEARVAWDIVEEIRASDNSAAYVHSEDDTLADPSENKVYYDKFLELKQLSELQKTHIDSVRQVTESIRAVKLSPPENKILDEGDEGRSDPILDHALSEAKRMTEEHGITSSQAKIAWEVVEEIASSDMSEAMKGSISEEDCLIEMIEACEAMDELNRALFLDSTKENGRYHG
mmetsp:Transcript_5889/g.8756  ORF Transcript_5889/g.8756 Transcript_5889/m.8756 type:complete len:233 (-) Transcript_5889:143-841(-)|eukprot:CAMPEP_0197235514 /NCGR_PEP_ID=MMETSP1429-20130617/2923_1 /TAXON_ID=49237 /ORGANISM="Chaetoceros  sp., Strain UNC1202" /LENGTH=232 /DNA_ID=CAMNT_0042694123 /DNA_START=43 /DNA_END=741 /DNA_ORIENTATION=+